MRITTRKNRRRNERLTLNMASMIDCTFLLLAYFLLTIVVLEPEDQLSSNIQPEQATASGERQDFQPQIIDVELVDLQPGYRLGSRLFRDSESLRLALKQLRLDSGLFVRVHPGPTVGFAASAMQAGRDAGFTSVTYVPEGG